MNDTARGLGPAHNPHWRVELGLEGLKAFRDGSATQAPALPWLGRHAPVPALVARARREPGWSRTLVRPHALGLSWARGKVPTPLGEIAISWERHGTEAEVSVDAPDGVQVDTDLRDLGATRVRLNGQEQHAGR